MEIFKTYVINLARDEEKKEKILQQLVSHNNLQPYLFPAIDGSQLSEDSINHLCSYEFKSKYKEFATKAALGCSLSHYYIYKLITQEETNYALILEDDAILSSHLSEILPSLRHLLDSTNPIVILLTPDFYYYKKEPISTIKEYNVYIANNALMTSGYLINYSAAKLLYNNIFPIKYLADSWNDFKNLGINVYGIVPHLISFPDTLGEIGKSQMQSIGKRKKIKILIGKAYGKMIRIALHFKGFKYSNKCW